MNRFVLLAVALSSGAWSAGRLDTLVAPDGSRAGLWVPSAAKKLPLVVWLHGGIGANNPAKGIAATSNMSATWSGVVAFALLGPSAWPASPWWTNDAANRVADLVEQAARRPGVDASKIVLAGASDGGSGALWIASALRKRWGPRLKGVAIWSANPDVMIAQRIDWKPAALKGLAVRWTAGGQDHLYPMDRIHHWWELCTTNGVELQSHETPKADHDLKFHQTDLALFPAWVRRTVR